MYDGFQPDEQRWKGSLGCLFELKKLGSSAKDWMKKVKTLNAFSLLPPQRYRIINRLFLHKYFHSPRFSQQDEISKRQKGVWTVKLKFMVHEEGDWKVARNGKFSLKIVKKF
jgi:hypothetical protein